MTPAEIAVREHGDKLAEILGGGDTMAMVRQVEQNVRAIVDISRSRGFITKFQQVNKKTGEVKVSEFYGLPAWQLLGMTYGVTPVVEWVKPIDGGYHARAVAQTRDGGIVGAAEALCMRSEPYKDGKSAHDLAAQAQARAERNALRTALGAVLVLAGFDFPDPEALVDDGMVAALHISERDLGMTHEQGHAETGVDSYRKLTREQAVEILERRSIALKTQNVKAGVGDLADSGAAGPFSGEPERPPSGTSGGLETDPTDEAAPGEPAPAAGGFGEGPTAATADPGAATISDEDPATAKQWEIAERHGLTGRKALAIAKGLKFPVTSYTQLTGAQLSRVLSAFLDRKRS